MHVLDYVCDHLWDIVTFGEYGEWGYAICPCTRGQVGAIDTDGDGVLDPMDVRPEIDLVKSYERIGAGWEARVTGRVLVGARKNLNPYNHNPRPLSERRDLNLDLLESVRYRLEQGPWRAIAGADGMPGVWVNEVVAITKNTMLTIEARTRTGQVRSADYFLQVSPIALDAVLEVDPIEVVCED